MKLLYSRTSPYVRKIRVVLAEKKIDCELVEENVWAEGTGVTRFNPITKIPTLVLDDGNVLYDSGVIAEYLDGLSEPPLIPGTGIDRALVRRDEALADAISDAAVAVVLERKRDVLRQDPVWIDRQRGKVESGIAALAAAVGDREYLHRRRLTLADIAAGTALSYVDFRLPEIDWRSRFGALVAYADALGARPSFVATRPPAP